MAAQALKRRPKFILPLRSNSGSRNRLIAIGDIIDDAQNLLLPVICVPRCEMLSDLRLIPGSVKSL